VRAADIGAGVADALEDRDGDGGALEPRRQPLVGARGFASGRGHELRRRPAAGRVARAHALGGLGAQHVDVADERRGQPRSSR
jgi:hypothetical protein